MVKKENDQELVSVKKTILSMSFSLVLVAAVLLFIFGFRYFLSGREYKGANVQKEERKNDYDAHKEYLETDKSFKAGYIMIKNLPAKGLYISELPGKKENSSTYDNKIIHVLMQLIFVICFRDFIFILDVRVNILL